VSSSPAGERARLFVALELPEDARAELERWGLTALQGLASVRLVPGEALHVTLCFLGWREFSEIEPIGAACDAAIRAEDPLETSIGEAVLLPARRPRVLAVRIDDPSGRLARVQASLSAELSAGGWYAREKRPFLGHVTIARLGRGARLRAVELPTLPTATFRATTVTLFRSRLGREGARYEPLRTTELTDAG
jgi:2'-5' RNA ligase